MDFETWLSRFGPVWAPDDDGGAGDGGDGAGDDDGGDDDKSGDGNGGGNDDLHGKDADLEPYRPDWLRDKLVGKDDRETLELIGEDWRQQREQISKLGTLPDSADAYTIELSESASKAFPIDQDDQVMPILKEVAHEFGIREQQIGFIPKLVDRLVEANVLQAPVDISEIHKQVAPSDFSGSDAEREAAGQKRLQSLEHQIDGLTATGYSKEEAGELKLLLTTQSGVAALERLMSSGVKTSVNPGGGSGADGVTKEMLQERKQDPRNDRNDPKYDPAFAKETENMYRRLYTG